MNKNSHSIQKVFLEIDTNSMVTANSVKNNLAVFLQNDVFPLLEKQFDAIENTDNQINQIEKLEISIDSDIDKNNNFFSSSETKNDLKKRIEREILKALNRLQKSTKNEENESSQIRVISPQNKQIKTLLYFLENGSLPWWTTKEEELKLFEGISLSNLQNESFSIPFQKLIQQKNVQKRIINQFSNYEIAVFGTAFSNSDINQKITSNNPLLKVINSQSNNFKNLFWQSVFEVWTAKKHNKLISFYCENQNLFSSKKLSFEFYIQHLKTFTELDFTNEEVLEIKAHYLNNDRDKSISISNSKRKNDENEAEFISQNHTTKEEIIFEEDFEKYEYGTESKFCYVQNAGLIILHPFLKEVLKSCQVIDDKNVFFNKELAVHLLHYAATKRENDYEHSMLFEKFLCGIPLSQSIKREVKIEDWQKKQVEEMLNSAVYHWTALKNTSTDVLRSEFLQRDGKLDWSESNPKLTIERKTQDLLLEKIPWNISIVKIPWIEKVMYTQW